MQWRDQKGFRSEYTEEEMEQENENEVRKVGKKTN